MSDSTKAVFLSYASPPFAEASEGTAGRPVFRGDIR